MPDPAVPTPRPLTAEEVAEIKAEFLGDGAPERDIGYAVLSEEIPGTSRQKRPVWLDELDPDRGDHANEPDFECSLLCAIAESELSS